MSEVVIMSLRDAASFLVTEALSFGIDHELTKTTHSAYRASWICKCGASYDWNKDTGMTVKQEHTGTTNTQVTEKPAADKNGSGKSSHKVNCVCICFADTICMCDGLVLCWCLNIRNRIVAECMTQG
jgi:hypothetical protein